MSNSSAVYSRNKTGPKTDPCGTAPLCDRHPLNSTRCDKNHHNNNSIPERPVG